MPRAHTESLIVTRRRSRAVAAGLAFGLGAVGAQHFYLGRTRAGVLSVLSCWTLVPLT